MPDYMPSADTDFSAWLDTLMSYVTPRLAEFGLAPADVAEIEAEHLQWDISHAAHMTSQAAARSAREAKDLHRKALVAHLRPFVSRLQAASSMTNEHRLAMGITARNGGRKSLYPTPTSRPEGSVDGSDRLRHVIRFRDQNAARGTAKPAGVMGCEIWVKIGSAAPGDLSETRFVALTTRTPFVVEYGGEEAGQTAHYILRWVNTRGERGPLSETISATIAG